MKTWTVDRRSGSWTVNSERSGRHALSTVHRPPSTVHHAPSTVHRPPSTVHHSPSTVHRPLSAPRGMSLLEVLAAIGVLSIGLFCLAALLPVGRYILGEAAKADRAGQCGRAALRDVIVRRMLDSTCWVNAGGAAVSPSTSSFLIDPEGVTNGMSLTFGNSAANGCATTTVPRISLNFANSQALADSIFQATDDLILPMPEDAKLSSGDSRLPAGASQLPIGRPRNLNANAGSNDNPLNYTGAYTWFLTVTPQPNNPVRFNVSVVVCFNRNRAATGERAVTVSQFYDSGVGGGSLQLARPINDIGTDSPPAGITIKENDWVALCNTAGLCRWYRVAAVGDSNPTDTSTTPQYLTLVGPDWQSPAAGSDKLVALGQSVVGVYTTTVELDTDPTWKN